jgi:hypothetical protein
MEQLNIINDLKSTVYTQLHNSTLNFTDPAKLPVDKNGTIISNLATVDFDFSANYPMFYIIQELLKQSPKTFIIEGKEYTVPLIENTPDSINNFIVGNAPIAAAIAASIEQAVPMYFENFVSVLPQFFPTLEPTSELSAAALKELMSTDEFKTWFIGTLGLNFFPNSTIETNEEGQTILSIQGIQGPRGLKGDKGDKGDTGATGGAGETTVIPGGNTTTIVTITDDGDTIIGGGTLPPNGNDWIYDGGTW